MSNIEKGKYKFRRDAKRRNVDTTKPVLQASNRRAWFLLGRQRAGKTFLGYHPTAYEDSTVRTLFDRILKVRDERLIRDMEQRRIDEANRPGRYMEMHLQRQAEYNRPSNKIQRGVKRLLPYSVPFLMANMPSTEEKSVTKGVGLQKAKKLK